MGGTQVLSSLGAVDVAMKTDPGRDPDKQVNEDAGGHRETRFGFLAVMCDGMGGHAGGKEASNLALKTIFEVFDQAAEGERPGELLSRSIHEANAKVFGLQTAERGEHPGSTVVATLHHANGTEVAHVGDSRVYRVHEGRIEQVTKDHSKVQLLVDAGYLKPEEAVNHPEANQILNALGMSEQVKVELRPEPIVHSAGDLFLLCSDGLSDLVVAEEIRQILCEVPPPQACGQLVDLANARGGHDNITVVLVRMNKSATRAALPMSGVAPTVNHGGTAPYPPTQASPVVPTQVGGATPTLLSAGAPVAASPVPAPPAYGGAPSPSMSLPPSAPPKTGVSPVVLAAIALALVALTGLGVLFLGKRWKTAHSGHDAGMVAPSASTADDASVVPPGPVVAPSSSQDLVPDDAEAGVPPTDAVPPLDPPPPTHGHHDGGHHGHRGAAAPSPTPSPTPTAPRPSTY